MRYAALPVCLVLMALSAPALALTGSFTADSSGQFTMTGAPPVFQVAWTSQVADPAPFGWKVAEAQQTANVAVGTIYDGSLTITANNGDKLFGTFAGTATPTADPNVLALNCPITFTGGTGDFTGATGSAISTGEVNLGTGTNTLHWTGTLVPEPATALIAGLFAIAALSRRRH